MKRNLLLMTYEMNENSQVFSHQIGVVNEIAKYFEKVIVLTGKVGNYVVSANVEVFSSNWIEGKKVTSILRFISVFLKLLFQKRFDVVFSHMTSVQSAIISPITKILKINHYLWYAHTNNNLALRVAHRFTSGVLTATAGSCPISSSKIKVVGHSIDANLFQRKTSISFPISRFIHVGRFDPSKNIELIVDTLKIMKSANFNLTFTNLGSPSGKSNSAYYRKVTDKHKLDSDKAWIDFKKAIPRYLLPNELQNYDAFIHAFSGSLDKAVLEATFLGLPVVTINPEYLRIFGSWDLEDRFAHHSLDNEVTKLSALSIDELENEVERRHKLAQQFYELVGWGKRVSRILKSG